MEPFGSVDTQSCGTQLPVADETDGKSELTSKPGEPLFDLVPVLWPGPAQLGLELTDFSIEDDHLEDVFSDLPEVLDLRLK